MVIKKTVVNRNTLFVFLGLCCLFLFAGCGLDEFYELDPPRVVNNSPQYDTEYANRYFKFTTNETGSNNKEYMKGSSSFKFLGTAVYYKIYKNYSSMTSDINSISTLSNSTNYSNAVSRIRESLGYQELGTSETSSISPLIEATGDNKVVYIRLTNYQESKDYSARIEIKTGDESTVLKSYVPRRIGNEHSFDFGRAEDDKDKKRDVIPEEDDSDLVKNQSFSDVDKKTYYVNMYAIAVGRDTTYSYYYSNVLHLGSVPICSTEKDN